MKRVLQENSHPEKKRRRRAAHQKTLSQFLYSSFRFNGNESHYYYHYYYCAWRSFHFSTTRQNSLFFFAICLMIVALDPWTSLESLLLIHAVQKYGDNNWPTVSQAISSYLASMCPGRHNLECFAAEVCYSFFYWVGLGNRIHSPIEMCRETFGSLE